jgi:hypothetical protein
MTCSSPNPHFEFDSTTEYRRSFVWQRIPPASFRNIERVESHDIK